MGNNLQTWLGVTLSLIALTGILARSLHLGQAFQRVRKLADLSDLQASFLQDWNGEPARPGYEGRLSFPERMTQVEKSASLAEQRTASMNHEMRGEMMSRLTLVETLLSEVEGQTKQLKRNGGSHLADTVHGTARLVQGLTEAVARLERTAEQNRQGIGQLDRRVTDVDEKATALGERQEVLRVADQQFVREMQHYIETEHRDLLASNEGLRAAVNELLSMDGLELEAPDGEDER